MPKFMEKPRYSMDVFRDSPVPKRYSKTGSAGSNDSDVPLTQMGYVPAGSTSTNNHHHQGRQQQQQYNNNEIMDNYGSEENHTTNNNSPAPSSSTEDSSVGPDIPLTTMHTSSSRFNAHHQESREQQLTSPIPYNRPRAGYNAGLANSGIIDYDAVHEEEEEDPIPSRYNHNNWSGPAPHHHHQEQELLPRHRFDFELPTPHHHGGRNNIPMPPSHNNNS
jgi:chitin synthase